MTASAVGYLLLACCLPTSSASQPDTSWRDCLDQLLVDPPTDQDKSAADNNPAVAHPLLLLIVDSLRWDYVTRGLPGFDALKQRGAYIDRVSPVFPAECYPNLYSMFTGASPIDHGAIFGTVYNSTNEVTFSYAQPSKQADLQHWLRKNVFWQRSANLNDQVRLFHLPICTAEEIASTICEPYSRDVMTPQGLNSTLTRALDVLTNGFAKVSIVFYDELDSVGHEHGPMSDEMLNTTLPRLDQVISDFVNNQLIKVSADNNNNINFIVTADHGMTQVDQWQSIMPITKFTAIKQLINRGSTMAIWPFDGKQQYLIDRLSSADQTKFKFYTNTSLPHEWRTGGDLFPPILLVANGGVFLDFAHWPLHTDSFNDSAIIDPSSSDKGLPKGLHGYDPTLPDMQVPLIAIGPSFRPGSSILQHSSEKKTLTHLDSHALISYLLLFSSINSGPGVVSSTSFDRILIHPVYYSSHSNTSSSVDLVTSRLACRVQLQRLLILGSSICLFSVVLLTALVYYCFTNRYYLLVTSAWPHCRRDDLNEQLIADVDDLPTWKSKRGLVPSV